MKPYEVIFTHFKDNETIEDIEMVYGTDYYSAKEEFKRMYGSKYKYLDIISIQVNYNY